LVPYSLSYMLDFWRKNWDNLQAAIDTAEAQEEALRVTILTITTDLASQYFQLRSYDEQLRILDDAIKVREDAVKINGNRFRVGIASEIDLAQAQADLSAAIATKDETIRLRGLAENQIAVLTGRNASDLSLFKNPLLTDPPLVPAGLTSDLLKRRPDISEAERQMAANNEKIGVAVASFFPTITITGALGAESPDIKQLFTYPSRYWSIGTNIEQILFDGGRLVSNYSAAKAQYEQAVANYRQTVLQSFQEVEDALISIKQNREKRKALVDTSNYNQRSVQLSQNRYNNGLVNYLEVEVQMKDLLQAQLNAQQSLSDQYLSTIQLIKALGGGWCSM
jgi:multidrug efflux system outer membrane protein